MAWTDRQLDPLALRRAATVINGWRGLYRGDIEIMPHIPKDAAKPAYNEYSQFSIKYQEMKEYDLYEYEKGSTVSTYNWDKYNIDTTYEHKWERAYVPTAKKNTYLNGVETYANSSFAKSPFSGNTPWVMMTGNTFVEKVSMGNALYGLTKDFLLRKEYVNGVHTVTEDRFYQTFYPFVNSTGFDVTAWRTRYGDNSDPFINGLLWANLVDGADLSKYVCPDYDFYDKTDNHYWSTIAPTDEWQPYGTPYDVIAAGTTIAPASIDGQENFAQFSLIARGNNDMSFGWLPEYYNGVCSKGQPYNCAWISKDNVWWGDKDDYSNLHYNKYHLLPLFDNNIILLACVYNNKATSNEWLADSSEGATKFRFFVYTPNSYIENGYLHNVYEVSLKGYPYYNGSLSNNLMGGFSFTAATTCINLGSVYFPTTTLDDYSRWCMFPSMTDEDYQANSYFVKQKFVSEDLGTDWEGQNNWFGLKTYNGEYRYYLKPYVTKYNTLDYEIYHNPYPLTSYSASAWSRFYDFFYELDYNYTTSAKDGYVVGDKIGSVSSTDSTAYPIDGVQDNYYYLYIDCTDVTIPEGKGNYLKTITAPDGWFPADGKYTINYNRALWTTVKDTVLEPQFYADEYLGQRIYYGYDPIGLTPTDEDEYPQKSMLGNVFEFYNNLTSDYILYNQHLTEIKFKQSMGSGLLQAGEPANLQIQFTILPTSNLLTQHFYVGNKITVNIRDVAYGNFGITNVKINSDTSYTVTATQSLENTIDWFDKDIDTVMSQCHSCIGVASNIYQSSAYYPKNASDNKNFSYASTRGASIWNAIYGMTKAFGNTYVQNAGMCHATYASFNDPMNYVPIDMAIRDVAASSSSDLIIGYNYSELRNKTVREWYNKIGKSQLRLPVLKELGSNGKTVCYFDYTPIGEYVGEIDEGRIISTSIDNRQYKITQIRFGNTFQDKFIPLGVDTDNTVMLAYACNPFMTSSNPYYYIYDTKVHEYWGWTPDEDYANIYYGTSAAYSESAVKSDDIELYTFNGYAQTESGTYTQRHDLEFFRDAFTTGTVTFRGAPIIDDGVLQVGQSVSFKSRLLKDELGNEKITNCKMLITELTYDGYQTTISCQLDFASEPPAIIEITNDSTGTETVS